MTKTYQGVDALQALEEGKILEWDKSLYKMVENTLLAKTPIDKHWVASELKVNYFVVVKFEEYIEPLAVGDWISIEARGKVLGTGKIVEEKHDDYVTDYDAGIGVNQWFGKHQVRKATPEEITQERRRRVFAKEGRKLNEFRIGDCVGVPGYIGYCKVTNLDDLEQIQVLYGYNSTHTKWVNTEDVQLIYPVEKILKEEF